MRGKWEKIGRVWVFWFWGVGKFVLVFLVGKVGFGVSKIEYRLEKEIYKKFCNVREIFIEFWSL